MGHAAKLRRSPLPSNSTFVPVALDPRPGRSPTTRAAGRRSHGAVRRMGPRNRCGNSTERCALSSNGLTHEHGVWNVIAPATALHRERGSWPSLAHPFPSFPTFAAAMNDLDLARRLRALRRCVLMLETELRHGRVDEGLLAEIDLQMERGIASDPRCAELPGRVDALRESTITPRPELHSDTIRACARLADAIEAVLARS